MRAPAVAPATPPITAPWLRDDPGRLSQEGQRPTTALRDTAQRILDVAMGISFSA
jgi:hypothetical protein